MSCDDPFNADLGGSDLRNHAALRVVRGSGHGELPVPPQVAELPEPAPRTGAAVVLADGLDGGRMSPAARFLAFLKAWVKRLALKPSKKRGLASMVRGLGQPGSIASHRAHVKAAAWFPPELEDSWLKWVRLGWVVFHVTWCRFLKVLGGGLKNLGNVISSAGDHARTAFLVLLAVIALVIIVYA